MKKKKSVVLSAFEFLAIHTPCYITETVMMYAEDIFPSRLLSYHRILIPLNLLE